MTDRDCKTCSHPESQHQASLFGITCNGRDWHDDSSYACGCREFVAKGAA